MSARKIRRYPEERLDRTARLPSVRATPAQVQQWERAARTRGISFGEWVRTTLDSGCQRS